MTEIRISEDEVLSDVAQALGSRPDVRLWRQNTGVGRGLHNPNHVIAFGVMGGGDLSGLVLVGGVGVRLEVECKARDGRQRKSQVRFEAMIKEMGGVYLVARSAVEATERLEAAIAAVKRRLHAG